MSEIKNFKKLIKDFGYYDKKSQYRILRGIERKSEESLNLDSNKRFWVRVDIDENSDESFILYRNLLTEVNSWEIINNLEEKYGIWKYNSFKNNKTNSGAKLFKFLKKKGYLSKESIEKITTKKNSQENYLCISQNPLDFLFCSSNQSFTSCLDINSDYGGAFYMGLLGLSVDKNRFLVFSTNNKEGFKTEIKGKTYIQPKINSRCWGLLGKNKTFVLETYYPHRLFKFVEHIKDHTGLEYIKLNGERINTWEGKYKISMTFDEDSKFRWVYLDNIGVIKDKDSGLFIYSGDDEKALTGNIGDYEYNYTLGLKKLNKYKYLKNGAYICAKCNKLCDTDKTKYIGGIGECCHDCSKGYELCDCCNNYVKKDIIENINGEEVCNRCIKEYYIECSECKELIRKSRSRISGNTHYCDDCYSIFMVECKDCGNYVKKDIIVDDYCPGCLEYHNNPEKLSIYEMAKNGVLKSGMKLRVVDKLRRFIDPRDPGFSDSMERYCGRIVTFKRNTVGRDHWIEIMEDLGNWTWDARWFTPIKYDLKREVLQTSYNSYFKGNSWDGPVCMDTISYDTRSYDTIYDTSA